MEKSNLPSTCEFFGEYQNKDMCSSCGSREDCMSSCAEANELIRLLPESKRIAINNIVKMRELLGRSHPAYTELPHLTLSTLLSIQTSLTLALEEIEKDTPACRIVQLREKFFLQRREQAEFEAMPIEVQKAIEETLTELNTRNEYREQYVHGTNWDEFRETGLLWWINSILHTFGWSIVVCVGDGYVADAYPARVKYRGFDEANNTKGYAKVTNHLAAEIERLVADCAEAAVRE